MNAVSLPLVFLDTAVPMYAAGRPHRYQVPCQWVMAEMVRGGIQAVIDAEVIQEVLHRYGALRRFGEAENLARQLLSIVPLIYPITVTDVQAAIALFKQYAPQGIPARDTLHAAVMRNNGISHILSPDVHFDKFSGITRIDPLALHVQAGQPLP